jgi:DNA excision repair protein ERCC-5
MGVKDLWSILGPVAQPETVNSLRGKCVAVDLSVWVCENMTADFAQTQRVKNPHLRNLFFRAWFLVSHGVRPVFVVEGDAPQLKARVMAARTAARAGTAASSTQQATQAGGEPRASRNHFKGVLKKVSIFLKFATRHPKQHRLRI